MTAKVIDGKQIAENKRSSIASKVLKLKEAGLVPGLAVILVGDDPASKTYVGSKQKACEDTGMHSVLIELPAMTEEAELIKQIEKLNRDENIHGILVQLPLPDHINELKIIETINPNKDVDGFHPLNIGRLMTNQDTFVPCTPYGIMEMLKEINVDITGKHVVIVGRSNIVGKPAGQLFLNSDATVTYCHSRTKNLRDHTIEADIIVAAVGKRNLITAQDVKQGAIVIDVGMNRDDAGKLCGDVDYNGVKQVASYITPVPGGVGPMTITMLLMNTLKAAEKSKLG